MKIEPWRSKLLTALVACGLLAPGSAHAAELGVNLVVNGDFESVDLATTGDHGGPRILGWTGPNMFALSHNGSSSNAGVVPDLAQGADPPNAGNWYFSSNNTGTDNPRDVRSPGVFYQVIDVSTGPTAAAIATGFAAYEASAFFASLPDDGDPDHADIGSVHVEFLNSNGDVTFGDANSDQDGGPNNVWSPMSTNIGILPGTTAIRVSLRGEWAFGGLVVPDDVELSGFDGYIDNVSLVITQGVPEPSSALLLGMAVLAVGGLRKRTG